MVVAMLADVIEITASADAQLWRHYLRLLLDGLDPVHARASRRGAKRARLALSREGDSPIVRASNRRDAAERPAGPL